MIEDSPKTNLNGVFIDLTDSGDSSKKQEESPIVTNRRLTRSTAKTIELNMNMSTALITTPVRKILADKNNNNDCVDPNQPCCSRSLPDVVRISTMNCSLCLEVIPKVNGFTLKTCCHNFCKKCLIQTIQLKHDPLTGAVKCPLEIENCDKNIMEVEIRQLLGVDYLVFEEQIKYNKELSLEMEKQSRESLIPILLNMDLEMCPNVNAFECTICFTEVAVDQGVLLQECLHNFCKECLIGHINASEEFEVRCPFLENDQPCKEFLREREIKAILSSDDFEKHIQKSLKLAENANELTFHCRTPDCMNFVEVGEGVVNFTCLACKKINCIACKAIHEGKTCNDYQEEVNPKLKTDRLNNEMLMSEDAIKNLIITQQAMYCPRCTIPVMKITGCDFITCTACKLGMYF